MTEASTNELADDHMKLIMSMMNVEAHGLWIWIFDIEFQYMAPTSSKVAKEALYVYLLSAISASDGRTDGRTDWSGLIFDKLVNELIQMKMDG